MVDIKYLLYIFTPHRFRRKANIPHPIHYILNISVQCDQPQVKFCFPRLNLVFNPNIIPVRLSNEYL